MVDQRHLRTRIEARVRTWCLGLHAVGPNAVAGARVACHNNQADSPRTDFKLNDDFGGIVIRTPLN